MTFRVWGQKPPLPPCFRHLWGRTLISASVSMRNWCPPYEAEATISKWHSVSQPGARLSLWWLNLRMCSGRSKACLKLWCSWAGAEFDGICAGPPFLSDWSRGVLLRLTAGYPQNWRPPTGGKCHQKPILGKVVWRAGRGNGLQGAPRFCPWEDEGLESLSGWKWRPLEAHSHSIRPKVSISQSLNTVYFCSLSEVTG